MDTPQRYEKRKADLIKYCRYYKGEEKPPSQEDALFWDYERIWVDDLAHSYTNADKFRTDYYFLPLGNFYIEVDMPRSLIGLLANRYMHWCGGYAKTLEDEAEGFKGWFKKAYLKEN